MFFNILVIVCLETLALCCFCAGFIFGKYSNKYKNLDKKAEPILLGEDILDPISPEDQQLIKDLEEASKKYVTTEEE